jgi:hypothetical protein
MKARVSNLTTNYEHILKFESELAESIENNPPIMERSTPIVLIEIAKTLSIIADTLENIERRLTSDQDNTLH